MRHNLGNTERIIRLVVGVLLILFSLIVLNGAGVLYGIISSATITGLVLTIAGITMFVTGFAGYCPMYALLHLNSCQACRLGETHKHMPV